MTHALFEYEWESQGDFLLDLVDETSCHSLPTSKVSDPINCDTSLTPHVSHCVPRYIPPHKHMTQRATLDLHNPQTTNMSQAAGVSRSVKSPLPTHTQPKPPMSPPSVPVVHQTEAPLLPSTSVPLFTNQSCIIGLNNRTATLCGCEGHFFWELIPSLNLNFFRGTVPDTVDHCICSMCMYNTFSEAFWDGYGQCVLNPSNELALFTRDYSLAVYQAHSKTCARTYTRYTVGSVKRYLIFNESLRARPIVGVYCKCKNSAPLIPAAIPYNVCFTCLQCCLELHAVFPSGVVEHFSFEVCYNETFLVALDRGVRNNSQYFLAQSLFDPAFSFKRKMFRDTAFMYSWLTNGLKYTELAKKSLHSSFCMICNHAGNGYLPFLCSGCTANKLKRV